MSQIQGTFDFSLNQRDIDVFRDEAKTSEGKATWHEVVEWFNSCLRVRYEEERIAWMEKRI